MIDNANPHGLTLTRLMPPYPVSAAVVLHFDDLESPKRFHAHFCNQITEGARHLLDAPIPAARQYVIYWPGVLEIPWPDGMTAQQAVAVWKDGVHGVTPDDLCAERIAILDQQEITP